MPSTEGTTMAFLGCSASSRPSERASLKWPHLEG